MSPRKTKKFHWQGFTSLLLTLSFLLMVISGVMLYLSPKGRVANWGNWTLLGLSKEEWSSVHMTLGLLMAVVAGFHLYFNWSVFVYYFKKKAIQGLHLKKELALAFVVSILFVAGTLGGVPPFRSVLDFNEWIKDYWEGKSTKAPLAHAEELTLEQIAEQVGLSLSDVVQALEKKGFTVSNRGATLKSLAEANGVAPSDLYEAIHPVSLPDSGNAGSGGQGFGRMTLEEACASQGLVVETVLAQLQQKGVKADRHTPLREIADALQVTPHEVLDVVDK